MIIVSGTSEIISPEFQGAKAKLYGESRVALRNLSGSHNLWTVRQFIASRTRSSIVVPLRSAKADRSLVSGALGGITVAGLTLSALRSARKRRCTNNRQLCKERQSRRSLKTGGDVLQEGLAHIYRSWGEGEELVEAFYNPAMAFNRDLAILVVSCFADLRRQELLATGRPPSKLKVLDATAATGLRAMRYALELGEDVDKVVACDCSPLAAAKMARNVALNDLNGRVEVVCADSTEFMLQAGPFDVIDIDSCGTASPLLGPAVQAVSDGGLLCVTSTDGKVLCGFDPKLSAKRYGGIAIRGRGYSKELGLRLLLKALAFRAEQHGRVVEVVTALWVDFYVTVFVRVHDLGSVHAPRPRRQQAMVQQCVRCASFFVSSISKEVSGLKGAVEELAEKSMISACPECEASLTVGGPFFQEPTFQPDFVAALLAACKAQKLPGIISWCKLTGMLSALADELQDTPLLYSVPLLQRCFQVHTMAINGYRAALHRLGFRTSRQHAEPDGLKTDAPNKIVFEMLRARSGMETPPKQIKPLASILRQARPAGGVALPGIFDFSLTDEFLKEKPCPPRFQENPKHWGPGSRVIRRLSGVQVGALGGSEDSTDAQTADQQKRSPFP